MRPVFGILLALLGIAALTASFILPLFVDGRSAWTDDQAARYSEANQQLHELAFSARTEENKRKLREVEIEQQALRTQLENAQQMSGRAAWWLRGVAVLLIASALFTQRAVSAG